MASAGIDPRRANHAGSGNGLRRKILIFTEPKDTLEYLQQKIVARLGDPAAVVVVHGGIAREAGALLSPPSIPIRSFASWSRTTPPAKA